MKIHDIRYMDIHSIVQHRETSNGLLTIKLNLNSTYFSNMNRKLGLNILFPRAFEYRHLLKVL